MARSRRRWRVARLARVSTYAYVNSVVAVFFGWAFASAPFTWVELITVSRGRHSLPETTASETETPQAAQIEPSHAMGSQ